MVIWPSGMARIPLATSMIPKVAYMTVRAPHRSDIQPPKGRNRDAGKIYVAVNRPAVVRLTSKLST